jgi:hypothetical protein
MYVTTGSVIVKDGASARGRTPAGDGEGGAIAASREGHGGGKVASATTIAANARRRSGAGCGPYERETTLPSCQGLAVFAIVLSEDASGHVQEARAEDAPEASCPPLRIVLSPVRLAADSLGPVLSGPRGGA